MEMTAKRVYAALLLACIILLVIHPLVDVPQTTLRSKMISMCLFYAIAAAFFSVGLLVVPFASQGHALFVSAVTDPVRSTLSALRC